MAEGGGLLNRYTLQRRIEGSNPSVSASSESLASLCTEINPFEPAIALFDERCPSIGRRAEPGKVVGAGHLDLRVESQCSRKPLIKTKEIVRQTGSNEVVLGRSRLRVFYATLARKVRSEPVGRALLHCLEGTFG